LLGISASYVEAIERGDRQLTNEMADEIGLRYGIEPQSLQKKNGFPRSILDSKKFHFSFNDPNMVDDPEPETDLEILKSMKKSLERGKELIDELDAISEVSDKWERLERSMRFWQRHVLHWKLNHQPIENVLRHKLGLVFEAAKQDNKFYPVTMRLSRFIEYVVAEFKLRQTIDRLRSDRAKRETDSLSLFKPSDWPSFIDSLGGSVWIEKPRRRKR